MKKKHEKLKSYLEKNAYKGYDPYDGLNSEIFQASPFKRSRFFRLAFIQLFKKLPVNLRPLVLVRKEYNAKGLALLISGYCSEYRKFNDDTSLNKAAGLVEKLLLLKSKGYSGACWGYNFDWQARAFFQPKGMPTVVATSYCAQALFDYYQLTKNEKVKEVALSSCEFILKDLNCYKESESSWCLSYSPLDNTQVFNASLLGARLLSQATLLDDNTDYSFEIRNLVNYCLNQQNEDGSWFYSTLSHHQWIDSFHTGFNLECLNEANKVLKSQGVQASIEKGLKYYLANFFTEKGESKYYNNSLYPIDLHAPAQLVVTLSKIGAFSNNKVLIDKVMNWTIDNMQSKKGCFYYQKNKFYTNKISYLRWTQAWMFYAMALYLEED